jgi:hypothetical protein
VVLLKTSSSYLELAALREDRAERHLWKVPHYTVAHTTCRAALRIIREY